MRDWRAYAPALVLALGAVLVASTRRQVAMGLPRPLAEIPLTVTGFDGVNRPISADEQRVAGMSDYVFRVFRPSGDGTNATSAFSVYVGYYESQATGRTIHSPRNCLPGAGWQSLEAGTARLVAGGDSVTVNRYILANGPSQAVVYYWYQGRGRVAWNEYRVKWDLLRDAALRGRTEEALVRVMVPLRPVAGEVTDEWRARLVRADSLATRVAQGLIPAVDGRLPGWSLPTT